APSPRGGDDPCPRRGQGADEQPRFHARGRHTRAVRRLPQGGECQVGEGGKGLRRQDRMSEPSGASAQEPSAARSVTPAFPLSRESAMQVQEIMTTMVEIIDPNTTIRDAARKMREENIGALPVGENDRLIGMVTDRDIAMRGVAAEQSAGDTTVRDVMSEKIYYCFDDQD